MYACFIHHWLLHMLPWCHVTAALICNSGPLPLQPFAFEYRSPAFSRNGARPLLYPGQYSTDVVAAKALAQIKAAACMLHLCLPKMLLPCNRSPPNALAILML